MMMMMVLLLMMMMIMTITMAILLLHVANVRIGCFDMDSQAKPKQARLLPNQKGLGFRGLGV